MKQKTLTYAYATSPFGRKSKWFQYGEEPPTVEIGDEVILCRKSNELTGMDEWYLVPHEGHGISENLNPDCRCYHGWRGTTDNVAIHAYGLRKVIRIRDVGNHLHITVGRDLRPYWD